MLFMAIKGNTQSKQWMIPELEKYQLQADEAEAVFDRIETNSYDKKMRVTDIGEQENYIHWVANGVLRKYFYLGKEEVVTDLAKEGDVICVFESFVKEKPSGVIIETIEHSTLYSLSKQNIEWLCDSYPGLQRFYIALISEAFLRFERRSTEKLIYPTKETFRKFFESNKDLIRRVPQKHLASYLDLKPETYSRFKHLLMLKN